MRYRGLSAHVMLIDEVVPDTRPTSEDMERVWKSVQDSEPARFAVMRGPRVETDLFDRWREGK